MPDTEIWQFSRCQRFFYWVVPFVSPPACTSSFLNQSLVEVQPLWWSLWMSFCSYEFLRYTTAIKKVYFIVGRCPILIIYLPVLALLLALVLGESIGAIDWWLRLNVSQADFGVSPATSPSVDGSCQRMRKPVAGILTFILGGLGSCNYHSKVYSCKCHCHRYTRALERLCNSISWAQICALCLVSCQYPPHSSAMYSWKIKCS